MGALLPVAPMGCLPTRRIHSPTCFVGCPCCPLPLESTRGQKTPDYLIAGGAEKLVVEIGGKGKGRQQFKGIDIDRKLVFADTDAPAKRPGDLRI